jgi:hypothetical protein
MQTNLTTLIEFWRPGHKDPLPDIDEVYVRDEVSEEFEEIANDDEYEEIKLRGYKEERPEEESLALEALIEQKIKEKKEKLDLCRKIIGTEIGSAKRIGIRRKDNEDEFTQTIGLFEEKPTYRDLLNAMAVFITSPYHYFDSVEFEETDKHTIITFTLCG